MSSNGGSVPGTSVRTPTDVLGYLVKHAHLLLESTTDAALLDLGVTSRDLGVLRVIAGGEPASQQEIAARVGVDRTSMVALVDALERKGLVARVPSAHDRRRNIVTLTDTGRARFAEAEQVVMDSERRFLSALGPEESERFRRALRDLVARE